MIKTQTPTQPSPQKKTLRIVTQSEVRNGASWLKALGIRSVGSESIIHIIGGMG